MALDWTQVQNKISIYPQIYLDGLDISFSKSDLNFATHIYIFRFYDIRVMEAAHLFKFEISEFHGKEN